MDKLDVERTQERFHIDGFKSGVLQTVLQFVSTVELHPNLEKQSPTVSNFLSQRGNKEFLVLAGRSGDVVVRCWHQRGHGTSIRATWPGPFFRFE